MNTRRVISNITFNSLDFFGSVCDSLVSDNIVEWVYWIQHRPDTDDTKIHIHFVLQPSKTISTDSLRKRFLEVDINNSLPIMPLSKWYFTTSIDDWILYCLHDVDYLRFKGLTRNVHYDYSDFHATDLDSFHHDFCNINRSRFGTLSALNNAITSNLPFASLVQNGLVPINLRAQYEAQYRALKKLYMSDNSIKGTADSSLFVDNEQLVIK